MGNCCNCHYEHVCSDARKKRHEEKCYDFYEREYHAFYAGGSPPRKFCQFCKHEHEKCISEVDIAMYAMNRGLDKDKVKDYLLGHGYVLTEYHMLEGQCMTYCDRFEETD